MRGCFKDGKDVGDFLDAMRDVHGEKFFRMMKVQLEELSSPSQVSSEEAFRLARTVIRQEERKTASAFAQLRFNS